MVEQAGFELATPRLVVSGKFPATLARYLAERKAAVLREFHRWKFASHSEPRCAFSFCFGNPDDLVTLGADFGAGLASEAKQSNVCGCPRGRVDSP